MKSIRLRTPAKINLFLRVLRRRADGYHDLQTLFQAIDLADEIIIRPSASPRVLVPDHPELETPQNLAFRALLALAEEAGYQLSAEITIHKRIPIAGGLGGGSSDAAAALIGLAKLFQPAISEERMAEIALSLGADVPFFLLGGTAVGEGVGEILTKTELPLDYGLVLVNPGFPVSTAAVFAEISRTLTAEAEECNLWDLVRRRVAPAALLHNDLQPAAERLHPEIKDVTAAMKDAGVDRPLMSGSGSTVFGILPDPEQARHVASRMPDQWSVFAVTPVPWGVLID